MDHRDGGLRRFGAFVSLGAAGAGFGLFERIRREHAEGGRNAGRHMDLRDPARDFPGDVLVVRRFPFQDHAQTDDRVDVPMLADGPGGRRNFESPGHPERCDVLLFGAQGLQARPAPRSAAPP